MVWGFWISSGLGLLDRQWFGVSDLDRSCQLCMQVIVMLCKSTVVVNCD